MAFFTPATRTKSKLRMAIDGVSGAGKTFTALRFAFALGKRVAVINSESGAIQKYLGLAPDGEPWKFDICELANFAPTSYTAAILAAGTERYDVLVIDSLSHAWAGAGGALELKDRVGDKNSFTAWRTITPMHNQMIEAILRSPCHIIVTMRSKTDYIIEPNAKGQMAPRKIGTCPVQRAGMEYEFDLFGSIDSDHVLSITKSRCPHPTIVDAVVVKPDANWIAPVREWCEEGLDIPADAFAVTEADLKKFEQRQSGSTVPSGEVGGAAAKLGVADLLKGNSAGASVVAAAPASQELKSHVNETSKPPVGGVTAVSPSLAEEREGFATKAQREAIGQLCKALNVTEDGLQAILKKRAVQCVADLSIDQAAEIIDRLNAKLPKPAEVAGVSVSGVGTTSVSLSDKCTPSQVEQITSLLTELEQTAMGTTKRVIDRLKENGRALIADLSVEEARELTAALSRGAMAEWFKVPF